MRQSGYLLCAEAARKVGVTPQPMYKWVDQGKVAGFRAGYRRYVKWGAVLSHMGATACTALGLAESDVNVETSE